MSGLGTYGTCPAGYAWNPSSPPGSSPGDACFNIYGVSANQFAAYQAQYPGWSPDQMATAQAEAAGYAPATAVPLITPSYTAPVGGQQIQVAPSVTPNIVGTANGTATQQAVVMQAPPLTTATTGSFDITTLFSNPVVWIGIGVAVFYFMERKK